MFRGQRAHWQEFRYGRKQEDFFYQAWIYPGGQFRNHTLKSNYEQLRKIHASRLSPSRWSCESRGLTPAANGGKRDFVLSRGYIISMKSRI
jgi:hypothetical protein